ncbi:MAG TPA: chorismate mutase [Vicinamibacterales bacterium]|jgi:chorismate mutase/prephenate dehydratase
MTAPVASAADLTDVVPLQVLAEHREYIDRIDQTIVALLAERVRIGLVLRDIKHALALPIRSDSREEEVLARVRNGAAEPLSPTAVERIFHAIIAETRAAQGDAQ